MPAARSCGRRCGGKAAGLLQEGLLRHTVLLERLLAQQKNSLLKQVGLLRPHHEDLPRRSLDHYAPSLSRTLSGIWRDSTRPKWVINGCR